nr:MAG TPA: hypothetical protein [Caudoviricetes sp.]
MTRARARPTLVAPTEGAAVEETVPVWHILTGDRIRLAGNAVVGLQARLMLQRGLTATNDTKGIL